ncbi:MAG TPA: thermonuclease family protein [Burkholderiaceae bacterium]
MAARSRLSAWICAAALALAAVDARAFAAVVVHVVDGDTLWVRPESGAGRAIDLRLAGIDAPERCQAGGAASRAALASRVLHRRVEVRVRAADAWGRKVARVWVDGADVNRSMVRAGQAWSPGWHGRPGPYAGDEAAARAERRGLFADPAAMPPWRFRRVHGGCGQRY